MASLFLSEMFFSIQGEGLLAGVPSVFVRTSGCNLRCRWCDTPYTSWEAEGSHHTIDDVLAQVRSHPARHVVITGGEPMLQAAVVSLIAALSAEGYHTTVETAGTVFRPVAAELLSISPKLASSTPAAPAAWVERHARARLDVAVLRALMAHAPFQLKFVVGGAGDITEIERLLERLGEVPADRVLLMPEGRTVAELDAHLPMVVEASLARGWRLCDRLHVRLFGNRRGT